MRSAGCAILPSVDLAHALRAAHQDGQKTRGASLSADNNERALRASIVRNSAPTSARLVIAAKCSAFGLFRSCGDLPSIAVGTSVATAYRMALADVRFARYAVSAAPLSAMRWQQVSTSIGLMSATGILPSQGNIVFLSSLLDDLLGMAGPSRRHALLLRPLRAQFASRYCSTWAIRSFLGLARFAQVDARGDQFSYVIASSAPLSDTSGYAPKASSFSLPSTRYLSRHSLPPLARNQEKNPFSSALCARFRLGLKSLDLRVSVRGHLGNLSPAGEYGGFRLIPQLYYFRPATVHLFGLLWIKGPTEP